MWFHFENTLGPFLKYQDKRIFPKILISLLFNENDTPNRTQKIRKDYWVIFDKNWPQKTNNLDERRQRIRPTVKRGKKWIMYDSSLWFWCGCVYSWLWRNFTYYSMTSLQFFIFIARGCVWKAGLQFHRLH